MAKAFIDDTNLTNIANAIRSKNHTNTQYLPSQMADAIMGITKEEKDVNFYDYDGTLFCSYTNDEALALTSLPPLPDRTSENLTNEGWNWTLADIKNQINQVGGIVDVGCNYHTTDGNTHIYYKAFKSQNEITILITPTVASDVVISWGDGSIDTISEAVATSTTHTYTVDRCTEFDIQISSSNSYSFSSYIFETSSKSASVWIDKINFSTNVSLLGSYSLAYLHRLKCVSFPTGIGLSGYTFRYFNSLIKLIIPTNITSTNNIFMHSFSHFILPSTITTINNNGFRYNTYATVNTIPYNVTYIGTDFMRGFNRVDEIYLGEKVATMFGGMFADSTNKTLQINRTTPPTLTSIASYIKEVRVPSSAVETYKAATNWANYADIIVAIPE